MKFKFNRLLKTLFSGAARIHLSQYGEDIILHKRYRDFTDNYFYMDVGAHHPFHLSNTAYLWSLGWNGINVDASQAVIDAFNKSRPHDLNLLAAIVDDETADSSPTITFYSSKDIDNCATCDPHIANERGLKNATIVPCISLSKIIGLAHEKFQGTLGLLNIDIEGLDDKVIQNIELWPQKPLIIMIEIYGSSIPDILNTRTYKVLTEAGYEFTQRLAHTAIFELQPT